MGLLGATLIAQGILVVTGILVVRELGVDARGEYAQLYAVLLLCSMLGLAGVPSALVYFAGHARVAALDVLRRVRGTVAVQILLAAVLALGLTVLLPLLGEPLSSPIWEVGLVTVGVPVVMVAQLRLALLQADHRFTVLPMVQLIAPAAYMLVLLLLVASDRANLVTVLAGMLGGWILVGVVAHVLTRRAHEVREGDGHQALADPCGDGPSGPAIRRFARRSMISGVAPTDQLGVDQLIIGVMLGHLALGYYVIGFAFETATVLPLVALSQFVGPRVARSDPARQRAVAMRWLVIGGALGLAICGVVQLVLGDVLVWAFGVDARPALPVARLLVLAGVLLGLRRLMAVVLANMGRPRAAGAAELVAFATMIVGAVAGSAVGGVTGSAAGLLAGGFVGSVIQAMLLWRTPSSEALAGGR